MKLSILAPGFLLLGALAVSPPASADCLEYADYLHRVGEVGLPLFASSVAAAGRYACNTGTLPYPSTEGYCEVIDLQNPQAPQILGRVSTPGSAFTLLNVAPVADPRLMLFGISTATLSADRDSVTLNAYLPLE